MKIPIDGDLVRWIDTRSKPWKPKDNAPEDIKRRIEDWVKIAMERQDRMLGRSEK